MRDRVLKAVAVLTVSLTAVGLAQRVPPHMATSTSLQREGGWELSFSGGAAYLDHLLMLQVYVTDPSAQRIAPGGSVSVAYHLNRMFSLSAGSFVGYAKPVVVVQPFGAITFTPNVDATTAPFLSLGGGITNIDWRGFKATSQWGANVGAGLWQALGERMALRLEVREQYDKYKDAVSFPSPVLNARASVGLSWFLGGHRASVFAVGVAPQVLTLQSLGATQQLSAAPTDRAGRPLTGRAVRWSSSNDSVATVSATGLVTAVGNGSATIRAASETGAGTAAVTVSQAAATLAVAPSAATPTGIGQTQQLTVTSQDANNNPIANPPVTWSSSNAGVVSVNASGMGTAMATALRNGTATITASASGHTAATTITVGQVIASLTVTPAVVTLNAAGARAQFTAQALDANGRPVTGRVVNWTIGAPGVATLSSAGLATAVGSGTAQITASVEGKTASAMLTVVLAARVAAAPAAAPAVPALPGAVELPAVNATLVLRNVIFRPNSARLPPEALENLSAVAQAMKAVRNARWEIGGYTSNMGDPAKNQMLSRRRALAVRTFLVRAGVRAASLVAVGYGPQNPIAPNTTVAGRRQNMRVEVKRLR